LPKLSDPAVLIFIGAVLGIIGGLLGGIGAFRASRQQAQEQIELRKKADEVADSQRELRKKSDEQVELQREISKKSAEIAALYQTIADSQRELRKKADVQAESQQQLRMKSDEIAELNQRIAEAQRGLRVKSDEIAELNRQIAASVTGGDNYCHVEFVDVNQPNTVMLSVINEGKLPAYDVVIKIVDVIKVEHLKKALPEHLAALTSLEGMFQKTLGNVPPTQAVLLNKNPLLLPESNVAVFEIHIEARNGTIAQVVRFERVEGAWTFATKATLLNEQKVLWQHISDRYPHKNIDDPDWWKIQTR